MDQNTSMTFQLQNTKVKNQSPIYFQILRRVQPLKVDENHSEAISGVRASETQQRCFNTVQISMTSALTVVLHTKYSIRTAHFTRNKGAYKGYSLRTSFGMLLLAIGSIIWSLLLPKLLFKLNFSPFSMTRKFKGVVMISMSKQDRFYGLEYHQILQRK